MSLYPINEEESLSLGKENEGLGFREESFCVPPPHLVLFFFYRVEFDTIREGL